MVTKCVFCNKSLLVKQFDSSNEYTLCIDFMMIEMTCISLISMTINFSSKKLPQNHSCMPYPH